MFIITREENDYNQYGEYFEVAFTNKPTKKEIESLDLGCDADHLLHGGGRIENENTWFNLREVISGERV